MPSTWGRSVLGFVACGVAASACLTPPLSEPASAVTGAAAAPSNPAAPVLGSITAPASGTRSAFDWRAPKQPECVQQAGDAGAIVATSSVVDFAQLRAGRVQNAAEVAASMRAGFRTCYQRALASDRRTAGTVRITILVACDGSITHVHCVSERISSRTMECLTEVVRDKRFDPPEGGAAATIVVPVRFVLD